MSINELLPIDKENTITKNYKYLSIHNFWVHPNTLCAKNDNSDNSYSMLVGFLSTPIFF